MQSDTRLLALVWAKAHFIDSWHEQHGFRRDDLGAVIQWAAYGDRNNRYGWEIDHIVQRQYGGSDQLSNLRPLHWRNNIARSA